jgi:hypothetical protein
MQGSSQGSIPGPMKERTQYIFEKKGRTDIDPTFGNSRYNCFICFIILEYQEPALEISNWDSGFFLD